MLVPIILPFSGLRAIGEEHGLFPVESVDSGEIAWWHRLQIGIPFESRCTVALLCSVLDLRTLSRVLLVPGLLQAPPHWHQSEGQMGLRLVQMMDMSRWRLS